MNILELKMNYTAFIKLRNFIKINDISAEIKEYHKKDDIITGKLDVSGTYLTEDLVNTNSFSDEILFDIIFSTNDFEIIDIDCVDLDYNPVDGRGIEVMFDVLIKYENYEIEENTNSKEDIIEIPVVVEENNTFEEIKKEKEIEIDHLIDEKLDLANDNLPTTLENVENDVNKNTLINTIDFKNEKENEKKRTIKICYYNDTKELDSFCENNNVGIDKIFNDNKKTDFVKYKRIILK